MVAGGVALILESIPRSEVDILRLESISGGGSLPGPKRKRVIVRWKPGKGAGVSLVEGSFAISA